MLLPYGTDGYTRGPDIDEFGSDAELSGPQAAALRKESISDLPRSQRRQLEKEIDKLRIQGMAMRSCPSTDAASDSTLSTPTAPSPSASCCPGWRTGRPSAISSPSRTSSWTP
ncbi:hypothetical protein H1V43_36690 [Streptomyces sp. PSKA54]|uniref:Uncharacterized protein n=1 Tax=Streptomyces himalayensis subsp. aureolus TaxID=2758039 RepID=A0A7W2D8Q4_9ACTN|nr:hypothetical protein [Streptomyces himalayensis]MBA4866739.1 hypothetical protein [Streptomyces himalayensis subsp. aureolus]